MSKSVQYTLLTVLACGLVLGLGTASDLLGQSEMVNVSIVDFAFNPKTITVPVGTTVQWTNNGNAPHTVTSTSGSPAFDSGTLNSGDTFRHTFTTAGEFSYRCSIHPSMTGKVIVAQAQSGPKTFTAKLDGAQEVPAPPKPNAKAIGAGAFVLSSDGKELGFALTYSDLSGPAVAIHFHNGEVGKAGPVVQTICGPQNQNPLLGACPAATNGTLGGVWKIPTEQAEALLKGNLYINVHTSDNPSGEIRGQIK
jgi:plastocyanin